MTNGWRSVGKDGTGCAWWWGFNRPRVGLRGGVFSLISAFVLTGGCDGPNKAEESVRGAVAVDTLEGGAVHVRNSAQGLWTDGMAWSAQELFWVGQREGDGPDVFGEIRDLAVDSRGRVYVADSQAEVIRVFDEDGEYVRTLGRPGQGPGELQLLRGVAIDESDRAWALDGGNFRYAVWDSSGVLVGTRERPFPYLPSVLRANTEGDRLIEYTGGLFEGADGRRRYGFVRIGLGDVRPDSFPGPQPPTPERFQVQPEPGGMTFVFRVPFTPDFHLAVEPDGRYWTGRSDVYRLFQVSLEGDTTKILERQFDPVVVTDAEIQAALDQEQVEQIRDLGGQIDLERIPRTKPVFDWVSVDDRGYLWVGLVPAEEGVTPVDVFDPDGQYLGQVSLPSRVLPEPVPVVRGAILWGAVRDEFDVQYLVRFRIEGRQLQ